MKKRTLGKSGIEVSPLCLGGNVFGWTLDPQKSFTVLDGFLAAGFEFIDTADVYSKWVPGHEGGESEAILGRWLKERGNRKQVIVATKVGMEMGDGGKGLSRAYILREVEASLKRLQSDYIDLYQSHQDDPDTPLEETMEAYAQLVKQGKVRAIGASNYKAERLTEALHVSTEHRYPKYETLQPLYNLYDREEYETQLEPACMQHGLGVIPYFSLASGFLTGKYRSEADLAKSQRGPGVKKYLNERGFRILSALDQVGEKYHSSPARVALGWLVARPSVTAAIASATNLDQLNELAEGVKLELDKASIALLNEASR
jgi:aryl-alcohol dehydrogenase-like predicted oxidoreductase